MNIETANTKAMSQIIEKLKKNDNDIQSLIPEIAQYLKNCGERNTFADVMRWTEIMLGKSPQIKAVSIQNPEPSFILSLKSIQPIKEVGLKHYFKRRKIQPTLVERYANQAWIFNHKTQKSFVALTFKNESGGDEIVNQHIASTSGKQDITFIRGKIYKPKGLHIFKNLLDFLALLSFKKVDVLNEDSIILNSWSNLSKVTPYIKGYGYKFICCWLEDSRTGRAATISIRDFIKTEVGTRFINMVNFYKKHVCLYNWYLNYSDNPSS